jgi:hypothetical protein
MPRVSDGVIDNGLACLPRARPDTFTLLSGTGDISTYALPLLCRPQLLVHAFILMRLSSLLAICWVKIPKIRRFFPVGDVR